MSLSNTNKMFSLDTIRVLNNSKKDIIINYFMNPLTSILANSGYLDEMHIHQGQPNRSFVFNL